MTEKEKVQRKEELKRTMRDKNVSELLILFKDKDEEYSDACVNYVRGNKGKDSEEYALAEQLDSERKSISLRIAELMSGVR